MKILQKYFLLLFRKIVSRLPLTLALFLSFTALFFVFRNGDNALTVLSFDLDFGAKALLFLSVLFDIVNAFSPLQFFLLVLIALLQSFVIVHSYSYMKEREGKLHGERVFVGFTSLLALFGASCAACGGVGLALLSSLGLTASSSMLVDSTYILSVVALMLLFILFRLLKKVENPFVC